jgi:hypothetical protein
MTEKWRFSLNSEDEQASKTEDFASFGVSEDINSIFAPEILRKHSRQIQKAA